MATGSWQGSRYGIRDLSPHRRPERSAPDLWRHSQGDLRRHTAGALGAGGIQTMKYSKPVGAGEHEVEHPNDPTRTFRVPSAQGAETYNPGQRVLMGVTQSGAAILGNPPGGDLGLSNTPSSRSVGVLDLLKITAVSPVGLQQGFTTQVDITGIGFEDGDTIAAAAYDPGSGLWLPDPFITLANFTFASPTSATVDVTVDVSAPKNYWISYSLERS